MTTHRLYALSKEQKNGDFDFQMTVDISHMEIAYVSIEY